MGKYHHPERDKSYNVWIKILDKDGHIIQDYGMSACFSVIKYNLDPRAACIQVYRTKDMMPYDVSEVKRWIDDINEMGFPCKFTYNDDVIDDNARQEMWAKETVKEDIQDFALNIRRHGDAAPPVNPANAYNFFVYLKDYVNKSHLFSTLSLIRALGELQMSVIPEIYFEMVDKNPNIDKFQALQDAHKKGPANAWGSHAITHSSNGTNIDRKTLMQRFSIKNDLYKAPLAINDSWNGSWSIVNYHDMEVRDE